MAALWRCRHTSLQPSRQRPPPALLCQAIANLIKKADLGRGRQEELPLSNVDERGRSYLPPRVDESKNYDPRIKQELNNKWASTENHLYALYK